MLALAALVFTACCASVERFIVFFMKQEAGDKFASNVPCNTCALTCTDWAGAEDSLWRRRVPSSHLEAEPDEWMIWAYFAFQMMWAPALDFEWVQGARMHTGGGGGHAWTCAAHPPSEEVGLLSARRCHSISRGMSWAP